MIDIHPPHHAPMTRREFFTHLGIVVLGILIAIGLEQAVEYFHHRHQLYEAREAIHAEIEARATSLDHAIATTISSQQDMQRNAALLRAAGEHDSTPTSALVYKWGTPYPSSNAWQAARANGAVDYMAPGERGAADFIYGDLDLVEKFSMSWLEHVNVARAIADRAPTLGQLTLTDREYLLRVTTETEGEIVSCRRLLLTEQRAVKNYLSVPAQSGKQSR
jgi:type II secretory pathway pseudopilin PulG